LQGHCKNIAPKNRVTFNAVAKATAVFLAVAVGIHARRESPTYEAHNLSRAYLPLH
jgi:hypothetical protein